ncbi:MAG: hypothetical protein ACRD2J_12560 [Thermoanaerobaculia bacterium]
MNRVLPLVVAVLLATPASAAVVYDFRQVNRSDGINAKPAEATGKGIIDGTRSRIEFTGGNLYPAGTVILSLIGQREVTLLNPEQKSYATIDVAAIASRIGAANLEITNFKTRVEQLPGQPMVSGFPTTHYRIVTNYDITWKPGSIELTQRVESIIEKWTTSAFGDVAETFLEGQPFRTGNPELDKIITAEMAKVKGLPLRQVTTTTTTGVGNLVRTGGQLPERPSRTQSSEILLSNVRIETIPEVLFEIPNGFRPADGTTEDGPSMHILSLEPEPSAP